MAKGDYATATSNANALGSERSDWKDLLLKLIDIDQEPDQMFSLLRTDDNNYKAFLEDYADTEGKDGQHIAEALLRYVCESEYSEPRPLPEGEDQGDEEEGRQMNPTVGIGEEFNENNFIQVYPNPAETAVTVYYGSKHEGKALVEVKDLLGKVIYSIFINSQNRESISLTNYSNGIYIITVTKDKELLYKSKLVKQK